jgi:hypothetical protein
MNEVNNISFFLEEKYKSDEYKNDYEIEKMLNDFEEEQFEIELKEYISDIDMVTNIEIENKLNKYDKDYTLKDLLKICEYYDIDKEIRNSKCKKRDIISALITFEILPENSEIVKQRHQMWDYISSLTNDTKMRKYVIWS